MKPLHRFRSMARHAQITALGFSDTPTYEKVGSTAGHAGFSILESWEWVRLGSFCMATSILSGFGNHLGF